MKVELVATTAGDLKLEVIAETDLEYRLLDWAWATNGYGRGDGRSISPRGGSSGFYVPLCKLVASNARDRT